MVHVQLHHKQQPINLQTAGYDVLTMYYFIVEHEEVLQPGRQL